MRPQRRSPARPSDVARTLSASRFRCTILYVEMAFPVGLLHYFTPPMNESLASFEMVRVETPDQLFLDGALYRPRQSGNLAVDAFLLLHGTGSNFYAPGVLETFTGQALAEGTAVLRVNTRGHDGICSIPARSGSVKGGATYERVSDCSLDVGAWVNWLERPG